MALTPTDTLMQRVKEVLASIADIEEVYETCQPLTDKQVRDGLVYALVTHVRSVQFSATFQVDIVQYFDAAEAGAFTLASLTAIGDAWIDAGLADLALADEPSFGYDSLEHEADSEQGPTGRGLWTIRSTFTLNRR